MLIKQRKMRGDTPLSISSGKSLFQATRSKHPYTWTCQLGRVTGETRQAINKISDCNDMYKLYYLGQVTNILIYQINKVDIGHLSWLLVFTHLYFCSTLFFRRLTNHGNCISVFEVSLVCCWVNPNCTELIAITNPRQT